MDFIKKQSRFMKTFKNLIICGLVLLFTFISHSQYYNIDDSVMGIYEGKWKLGENNGDLTSQIRPVGDGLYDGFVLLKKDGQDFAVIKVKSQKEREGVAVVINGKSDKGIELAGKIEDDKFTGKLTDQENNASNFLAVKLVKRSPTLGEKPPKGAIVLFDGKDTNQFKDFTWKLVDGDAMEVGRGDVFFKGDYKDFKLHVEFRTPFMPKERGQARGNSGVYLWSMYEVQVLDSFGIYPLANNDCGAIYSVKAPPGNNCLPPMEWQTYDITYYNGDGTTNNPPTITVYHNGVLIHDNVKIPAKMIGKGGAAATPGGGILKLQDHGNPVQYRNIWLLPL